LVDDVATRRPRRFLMLAGALAALAICLGLPGGDLAAHSWVVGHRSSLGVRSAIVITTLGTSGVAISAVFVAALILTRGGVRTRLMCAVVLVGYGLCDLVPLRTIGIDRTRPAAAGGLGPSPGGMPFRPGMPSTPRSRPVRPGCCSGAVSTHAPLRGLRGGRRRSSTPWRSLRLGCTWECTGQPTFLAPGCSRRYGLLLQPHSQVRPVDRQGRSAQATANAVSTPATDGQK
jgi:hypothetical protein